MTQQDLAEQHYASVDRRAASVDTLLLAALGRHQSVAPCRRGPRAFLASLATRRDGRPASGGRGVISGLGAPPSEEESGPTEGQVRAMIVGALVAALAVTQFLSWWKPEFVLSLG